MLVGVGRVLKLICGILRAQVEFGVRNLNDDHRKFAASTNSHQFAGLDCYLRLWDSSTRQLLSAVFLKQHLTNVILDPYYTIEETTTTTKAHLLSGPEDVDEGHNEMEEEPKPVKRKKAHKKIGNHQNNKSSKKAKKLE
ncbi:hypothetical protein AKJ16_DCAP26384 [Drosera capensis]